MSVTWKEDPNNPGVLSPHYTDPNNTVVASTENTNTEVKSTEDSVITQDQNTTSESINTGILDPAEGTNYSWNTKAEERAGLNYESQVLEAKSQYLTNRQELESQGQQGQEQVAMQKYSQNQSNEKTGWTGGYVLDTERQMSYLKQTIQSQMYGAMELQKYGYDTSLAAARLAYDTNKYDLALEYYNTALSRAVSEADRTGFYIAPEAREMLDQYSLASKDLEEGVNTERAQQIIDSVNKWFESNGISKQGVKTLTQKQWEQQSIYALEQSYKDLDKTSYKIDSDTFVTLDDNGNPIYTEDLKDFEKINFKTSSPEDLYTYLCNEDGSLNEHRLNQYFSKVDSIAYEFENNFKSFIGEEGKNKTTDVLIKEFKNWLADPKTIDLLQQEVSRWSNLEGNKVQDIFKNYEVTIELPNGQPAKLYLTTEGTTTNKPGESKNPEDINNPNNPKEPVQHIAEQVTELVTDTISKNTALLDSLSLETSEIGLPSEAEKWIRFSFLTISDLATNIYSNGAYADSLTKVRKAVTTIEKELGDNISILETGHAKFKNLSDEDKNLLTTKELEYLKKASEYYIYYQNLKQIQDHLENQVDEGGTYEMTSDAAGRLGDIWDNGYQFGDIACTIGGGINVGVTAIGETLLHAVGKGWIW